MNIPNRTPKSRLVNSSGMARAKAMSLYGNESRWNIIVIFTFLTIQLGFSYYVSTQLLGFLFVVTLVALPNLWRNHEAVLLVTCAGLGFFFGQFNYTDDALSLYSFLRCGREFLCFAAIISAIYYTNRPHIIYPLVRRPFVICAVIILCLVVVQLGHLLQVIPLNLMLPANVFSMAAESAMRDMAASAISGGYESFIRPAAFYTEPSYMGFLCLCLMMALHREERLKENLIIFCVLFAACLISRTASGVVILYLFFIILNYKIITTRIYASLIISMLLVMALVLAESLFSRLLMSRDVLAESSGYVRLVFPMKVFIEVLTYSPAGVPPVFLDSFVNSHLPGEVVTSFDNGVLNILVYYGYFGLLILALIAKACRRLILFSFILFCGCFNGSLFSYDKVTIIVITLMAYTRNITISSLDDTANSTNKSAPRQYQRSRLN